ncbi:MAG: M13 family peptidase [Proteobacteria bacterium]|nr:M13 family peptidase [Verrucomicrobiota bacterium]NBU08442.1 M13 family peptidase [Pseudomonadota bacterium]
MRALAAGTLALNLMVAATHAAPRPPEDLLRRNMDPSVQPGVDFFTYANGGWLRRNPIPASESRWGIGEVVREELYTRLRQINERAARGTNAPGTEQQKIGDFWATAMDTAKAARLGLGPLRGELQRIDAIQNVPGVLDVCFAFQPLGVTTLFGLSVSQDEKRSDIMAVHLSQDGLGLPERDFYFNEEKGVAKIRAEYGSHIQRMLKLLGRSNAEAKVAAARVMEFETALAKVSRKLEDLRDPEKNYNPLQPAELTRQHTPSIRWQDRLNGLGLHTDKVIVGQPEFFTALEGLLHTTPVPVMQDYLRFHLVSEFASYLDPKFDAEHFAFYGKVLNGQKEPRPRWKRVLNAQEGAMGMVLGRIFVQEYFPAATKQRYVNLVEAIRAAYRARIDRLDWMSAATKAKAQAKLAAMTAKVGYPDTWKDYSTLMIGTNSYAENMMNAARWHYQDMLAKYGKPVDRSEWSMTPQTYNAYYKPENNEIVLPAAQFTIPGIADADVDDAVAFGYTGASTIGHEITHGFDDEGRQFDEKGNLADWWTAIDATNFQQRAEVMVKQFDAYQPLPGLRINGKASLGENIADHGGLLLGLDAFKQTEQFRKGEKIAGLTPMQRFFLGYALGWLTQEREASLRRHLLSDVHAPAKWRVLGPLSNLPEFHEAFGVKPGQPLWRPAEVRVKIW